MQSAAVEIFLYEQNEENIVLSYHNRESSRNFHLCLKKKNMFDFINM